MLNICRKALHPDSLAPQDDTYFCHCYFLDSATQSDWLLFDIVFFVGNTFSCCRTVNNCPVSLVHSLGVIWFLSSGAIILLKTVIIVAFPPQSWKLCFIFTRRGFVVIFYFHPEDLLLFSPSKDLLLFLIFSRRGLFVCYCHCCPSSLFSSLIKLRGVHSSPLFAQHSSSKLSETFWQKI